MSSAERAATILPELEPEDLRVLQAVELGLPRHEFVPLDQVVRYSGLNPKEAEYRLGGLDKRDLIYRQPHPYLGFILNYTGYDCLALNALVKGGFLDALGRPLGVGKEADVFEALTPGREQVAVKFHRLGRTSFRDTRRKREYVADRQQASWLYQSRLAAEKEFEALERAYGAGVSVPRPLAQNRHVLVMGFIEGYELYEVDRLDDPTGFLEDVLDNMRRAYAAGIIHSDLSEFNILVTPGGKVLLIDWPQYKTTDHPNAQNCLERDIKNVLTYFKKKFGVDKSLAEALAYVKG